LNNMVRIPTVEIMISLMMMVFHFNILKGETNVR
jgi:hypothetical protein